MDLHTWMLNDVADVRRRLRGVLDGVPAAEWKTRCAAGGPSLAHLALHLARHQDLAVNVAIRNHAPRFFEHRDALGVADAPAWAGLAEDEEHEVVDAIDLAALDQFVDDVFDATTGWLAGLGSMVLDTVPATARRLHDRARLPPSMDWLASMWDERPVWWLLQWPVIGHGHAHAGQAGVVRNLLGHNPFATT